MASNTVRLAAALGLPLVFAAPALQTGFSSQCTNIKLVDQWLVADCPASSGTVTSSVYLSSWLSNIEGVLTWNYDGNYENTCTDCSLAASTLTCTCRKTTAPTVTSSINLEEHIASYDGHLLSDLNGTPSVPANGSVPVPESFSYSLNIGGTECTSGASVSGVGPKKCYAIQYAAGHYVELAAIKFASGNPGYSITAYSSTDCTGEASGTVEPVDSDTCKTLSPIAQSFSVVPLFNADW